jgi:3-methyl-2-oxobutanoate hydroxymethyltransferase
MANDAPYTSPGAGAAPAAERKIVTVSELHAMRARNEPIVMLTCYDASFAALEERCAIDVILIGDSLGMVIQGDNSTARVSLGDIIYHVGAVSRGARRSFILADMPWNSYHQSPQQAFDSAAKLIAAGAHMVKMEGGDWLVPTTRFLTERGIAVCTHLGLMPQAIPSPAGYRVQGRDPAAADAIVRDAKAHVAAGAQMVLLELVPNPLGKRVTEAVDVPVIGIGAGPDVSGQVLVLYDILDVYPGRKARFVKNYLTETCNIEGAIRAYHAEVKSRAYPAPEHCFPS